MNRGQINGFTLNGSVGDPVVRVRIDAKGYARVRARGRVLAYAVVHGTPEARQIGKLGRVEANLSVAAVAQAAVAGAIGRVDIHGLLQATGRVVIEVKLPPVRGRIRSKPQAQIALKAHAFLRTSIAGQAQAKFAPQAGLLRRGPVKARGVADITADGTVYARRWLRVPTDVQAQAFIVTRSRVDARLAVLTQAVAEVVPGYHVQARDPLVVQGVAFIEIDTTVNKRLPFDEPAPESRTFIVQPGEHVFYVTE